MNRQTITVDIAPGSGPVQRLKVSQGDIGRPLGVYIIQNGAPLDCSGYNADLYVLKPDGNYYVASATVATTPTNLVTWITATQETPIAGECKAQIRIRENGNDIGTANFVEFVEATPGYLGSASESDFHLIEEYVEDAEAAADRAEEATTKNPRISETTDNWEIWNASTEQWTDTGVPATGPQGPQGERGPTGYGTPAGGATGQVLRKNTATDYDFVWDTLTGDEIALSDSDSTTVTESLNSANQAIANLQDGLAIVANGNTHAAITSGQFVYVKNHSTLADGLYKATAAIATNGTLSTSNLTADSSGGLNDLKGQVDSLNSKIGNLLRVEAVTIDAVTVAAGAIAYPNKTASLSGYTPIGVVGYDIPPSLQVAAVFITSAGKIAYTVKNITNASVTVALTGYVLYVKP